jgi:serine/threonine protein kinase
MQDPGKRNTYALGKKPIGVGGQCEVFEALHKVNKSRIAFKRTLSKIGSHVKRMKSEIDALKALNHPHIMPLLDWSKDFTWYTMPIAVGSLETEIKNLSVPGFKKVLLACCDALDYAQKNGYVHRDIKPSNILKLRIEKTFKWVVSDWGLVSVDGQRSSQRLTLTGQALGTKDFAAPELESDAKNADFKCDIYSLGKVAQWGFHLIGSGRNSLPDSNALAKMTAHYPSTRPASYPDVKLILQGSTVISKTDPEIEKDREDPIIDVFHSDLYFKGLNKPVEARFSLEQFNRLVHFLRTYKENQISNTPFTLIEDLRGKYLIINAEYLQKILSLRDFEHKDYYKYEVKVDQDGFPDYDHIFNLAIVDDGVKEYRFESAGDIWNEFNNITEFDKEWFPFIDWEVDGDPTFINTCHIQYIQIEKAVLDYGADDHLEEMNRDMNGI